MRIVSAWLGHKCPEFTFKKYHHYLPPKLGPQESLQINNLIFNKKNDWLFNQSLICEPNVNYYHKLTTPNYS